MHDLVGLEQADPVAVKILIGECIPLEPLSIEPVDDHQIGGELPWGVSHEPAADSAGAGSRSGGAAS